MCVGPFWRGRNGPALPLLRRPSAIRALACRVTPWPFSGNPRESSSTHCFGNTISWDLRGHMPAGSPPRRTAIHTLSPKPFLASLARVIDGTHTHTHTHTRSVLAEALAERGALSVAAAAPRLSAHTQKAVFCLGMGRPPAVSGPFDCQNEHRGTRDVKRHSVPFPSSPPLCQTRKGGKENSGPRWHPRL